MGDLNKSIIDQNCDISLTSNKSNSEKLNVNPIINILEETQNLTQDIIDFETNRIQFHQFNLNSSCGLIKIQFEGNQDSDNPNSSIKVYLEDSTCIKANFNFESFTNDNIATILEFLLQSVNKYPNTKVLKDFLSNVMQASVEFML